MQCPLCHLLVRGPEPLPKAKVVKTENTGLKTHRIYRCVHPKCGETFHTIEINRDRFRELIRIEDAVRDFADSFHR